MNGSFTGANIISILLRKKFTARHWLRVLANINKYPCNGSRQEKPQYYRTTESDTSSYFVIYGQYLTDLHHHNVVPKITLEDVLSGRVQCQKSLRSSDGSPTFRHTVAIFIVVTYLNQVKSRRRIIVPIRIKSRKKGYSVLKMLEFCKNVWLNKDHLLAQCFVRQGSSQDKIS
jgi:hypothetical protein